MPRLFSVLLMLPFLIGCSGKTEPGNDENPAKSRTESDSGQPEGTKLKFPSPTTDEQLAEKLKGWANAATSLFLANSKITDAGLAHLKGLENLKSLNLVWTKITDEGLVHLKGLTNLEKLYLSVTKITDAGLIHLKGLTKLKLLNLLFCKITDAGLLHLKGPGKLENLNLLGTKVTDAGVKSLKKALPDCKIRH